MDIRRNVSHYKKPILIVSGLLLVYCLLLAVVLPVVLKAKLPGLIQQATGRNVSVADIVVQPVPLAIQVDG